jgi:lysophospholipid acyltransferase (LPLAT)-like uncharacterized protein
MREKILGFISFLLIRLIGMTLRYRLTFTTRDAEEFFKRCFKERKPTLDSKYLLAFFHQDELCLLNYFRNRNMSVLISISKDGQIMNNAAGWLGYKPVRGSSSKKAVSGLIAGIRKVREGYKMAFAVDGPRGPIYEVKEGICAVASKTDTKIVPIRAKSNRQLIFKKSWNQAKFPLPFAIINLHISDAKIYNKEELQNTLQGLNA